MKILVDNFELYIYYITEFLGSSKNGQFIYQNEILSTIESKIFIHAKNIKNYNNSFIELIVSRNGPIEDNIIARRGSMSRPYLYLISENVIDEIKKSNYIMDFKTPPVCFSKDYSFEKEMHEKRIGEKILEKIKEELDKD